MSYVKSTFTVLILFSLTGLIKAHEEEKSKESSEQQGEAKKSQSGHHIKPASTVKEKLTRLEQEASNLQRDHLRQVEELEKELLGELSKKKEALEKVYLAKLKVIYDQMQELLKTNNRDIENIPEEPGD